MRLYHVSEEDNITIFTSRKPERLDLTQSVGLVWAVDEERVVNYLTPRECPRVTYHVTGKTSDEDRQRFFTSPTMHHAVIIECDWYERMKNTTLYLYEFETLGFVLQDEVAGYYVSETPQKPIAIHTIEDPFAELVRRNVEVRLVDCLLPICRDIQKTTLNWSMCRMRNARSEV